jgi:tripartite-type tricarboxylate transporter receptor subunit TctC
MALELLASRAGITLLHVPYKGSSPALVDLISGQLQVGFEVVMTALPHVESGQLRPLAVSSPKRLPYAPQIPTVAESGFPGYEASVWFGLFAPAGTPPAVVNKISADSRFVLNEPQMREKLQAAGFEIVGSTPAAFTERVKNEVQKWRKVVKDANLKLE